MATIKLGPKFFRKERDNLYSDWPTAFWREMFQNSLDANASRIVVRLTALPKGCKVYFGDNGHGMTRDVLERVFFSLGETTKAEGSTGVGGFGRARILTCFAMESYSIRTRTLEVQGQAAEYNITDGHDDYEGCDFEVVIADKDATAMMTALKTVLGRSQLDGVVVEVNGARWTEWMYRRRLTRELDCGGVYVNNSQPSNNKIIVRVKGLYMFDLYTSARPQVIVEVDPTRSRQILTISRDSFHYAYQNNLTQFLAEVAVDKRSALKSRKRKTKLIRGKGIIVSNSSRKMADPRRGSNFVVSESGLSLERQKVAEEINVNVGGSQAPEARGEEAEFETVDGPAASRPVDVVEAEVVEGEAYARDLPSIYINDETENPKIAKIINNFDPNNWVNAIKNVRGRQEPYRKGSTYLKLLLAWRAAVEEAMRALLVKQNLRSVSWLVGWDFSDDAEASHILVEGAHAICLNPVDKDGQLRYKISSREDLMALMALAKHEVAHVVAKVHDEDFSTLHTNIDKAFDPWVAMRKMREAISSAN